MAKISIRSVAPTFRRAGIQFSRLDAVEVDTELLTEEQAKQLDEELQRKVNLVIVPSSEKDASASEPGGTNTAAKTGDKGKAPVADAGGQGGAKNPNTQPAKKDADGSVPGGEKAAGAPSVKAPTGNAKRSAAKAAGKAK